MSQGLFIELWQAVRDKCHENNTSLTNDRCKQWVNDILRDIAQEYDWEFLRGLKVLTTTGADQVMDLNWYEDFNASANTIYVSGEATADAGSVVRVIGKRLNADGTYSCTAEDLTLVATANATGTISWAHIDSFQKAAGSGHVYVKAAGTTPLAILEPSETYVANDIYKILSIYDATSGYPVLFTDMNTQLKSGNVLASNYDGSYGGYDIYYDNHIQLMNVASGASIGIVYQRRPKYLVFDYDRTEFPYSMFPAIANIAYQTYGKRYEDEVDGTQSELNKRAWIEELIAQWTSSKDTKPVRVIPRWFRETL